MNKGLGGIFKLMKELGAAAAKTILGGAAALTGFIAASIIKFGQLESGITEIVTLFGAVGQEAKVIGAELTDIVQTLVTEFGQKTPEAIKATYDAVSAGIKQADIGAFMKDAARLAVAGVTDIATSVDLLTSVMNAYGLEAGEAEKVSDLLFTAVKKGKTTIAELGGAIGRVAPIAKATGVGLDELAAFMATVTAQGINTNEAATALKAALANILKPSEKAAKLAKELGIEFNTQALEAQGLQKFLVGVTKATGSDQDKMGTLFGSIEGLNAILAATSEEGGAAFKSNLDAMKDSAGAVKDGFEETEKTISFKWKQLSGNITVVMQEIGDAFSGPAKKALEALTDLFTTNKGKIDKWTDSLKKGLDQFVELLEEGFSTGNFDKIETFLEKVLTALAKWVDDLAAGIARGENQLFNSGLALGKAMVKGFVSALLESELFKKFVISTHPVAAIVTGLDALTDPASGDTINNDTTNNLTINADIQAGGGSPEKIAKAILDLGRSDTLTFGNAEFAT